MLKILQFTLLISLPLIILCADSCTPLWPRLEYGNIFYDGASNEKLIIRFNTRSPCNRSYAVITSNRGVIKKVDCESSTFTCSQKMNNYQIFMQRCSVSDIQFEQNFNYIAYGSNSSNSGIPFDTTPIQIPYVMHPNATRKVNLIFLADWSELIKKASQYTSINSTLDKIRTTQKIDGMIVNGDIAYNLDSNNGRNYEDFLNVLSRIARFVPTFINTGNHQHYSVDDLNIFYFTFEQYNKDKILATGLNLGPVFLVGFDPFDVLYHPDTRERNLRFEPIDISSAKSFLGLSQIMTKAKQSNKRVVTTSHYQFVCSVKSSQCTNFRSILNDYFTLMIQSGVKLYIGAHMHTYQRDYPYCQNDTFLIQDSPQYNLSNKKCFISIIEGAAGNDQGFGQKYQTYQAFTAYVENNNTGIGLLSADSQTAQYQHFTTKNVLTLDDKILINWKDGDNKQIINKINRTIHFLQER